MGNREPPPGVNDFAMEYLVDSDGTMNFKFSPDGLEFLLALLRGHGLKVRHRTNPGGGVVVVEWSLSSTCPRR